MEQIKYIKIKYVRIFIVYLKVAINVLGSRNLSGNRDESYDDLDFLIDGRGRPVHEDHYEGDFVMTHRRFKERAAAAFEEDLAELRRKRRDMQVDRKFSHADPTRIVSHFRLVLLSQDRIFDVIDLNAEIEKAKSTLEAAEIAFQRHATGKDDDEQSMSVVQRLDRSRKIANMDVVVEKPKPNKPFLMKWIKVPAEDTAQPAVQGRQRRINSLIDTSEIVDPLEAVATQPMKRKFLKRKKSVSF